jgi:hypothetical protein
MPTLDAVYIFAESRFRVKEKIIMRAYKCCVSCPPILPCLDLGLRQKRDMSKGELTNFATDAHLLQKNKWGNTEKTDTSDPCHCPPLNYINNLNWGRGAKERVKTKKSEIYASCRILAIRTVCSEQSITNQTC